jgi:hypothetical protein
VAAQVHLEEAVLGADEPLRAKEVAGVVGVDRGHALGVAMDRDRARQALDRELARGLREGLPHHTDRQDPDRDHRHDDEDGEEQDDPTGALQP